MAQFSNSRHEANPSYPSRLKSAQANCWVLSSSSEHPFSVDAAMFWPRPGVPRPTKLEEPLERQYSPDYALSINTFLPPDTPTMDCPSTPPSETRKAKQKTPCVPESIPRGTIKESPTAKVGDLFHGLGSIWAADSNDLSFAHNRGNSAMVHNGSGNQSSASRGHQIQRPRSRSDAPGMAGPQGYPPYTTPNSRIASKEGSVEASPVNMSPIAAPSARRQLFPTQGMNEPDWHASPVKVKKQAPGSANMNDAMTEKFQHMSIPPENLQRISPVANLNSQFRATSAQTPAGFSSAAHSLASHDFGGRETPGGVPLSAEFKSSHRDVAGPRTLSGNASPKYGNIEANAVVEGPNNGSFNNFGRCISSGANSEMGSGSVDSAAPVSAKAARAKFLADIIKSGGAEPTEFGARAANMAFVRTGFAPKTPAYDQGPQQPTHVVTPLHLNQPDRLVEQWKAQGRPTWNDVAQNLAFVDRTRAATPTNFGVIKLTDIPYTTTKPEIVALIGEKAPMVQMPRGTGTYAIHIIMERGTAKSMDAYVEFSTQEVAQQVCSRLENHARPLIQARRVTIQLSSQEALMKDLFPRAKCVRWEGSQPVIVPSNDAWSAGFQGFVSSEELVMVVKVAQNPQRSRFAIKHQQRTYESMISLMFKFPWFAIDTYTLAERDLIFKAVRDQVLALSEKLRRDGSYPPVDNALLQELLDAGLKCPGFSEKQRACLIDAAEGAAHARVFVTPIAHDWPFEVLDRKDGLSEEFVMYFISLIRSACTAAPVMSLAEMSATNGNGHRAKNPYFGDFQVIYPRSKNEMTMAAAAKVEWDAIEHALRKAVSD